MFVTPTLQQVGQHLECQQVAEIGHIFTQEPEQDAGRLLMLLMVSHPGEADLLPKSEEAE
jgi:hypothetical protein